MAELGNGDLRYFYGIQCARVVGEQRGQPRQLGAVDLETHPSSLARTSSRAGGLSTGCGGTQCLVSAADGSVRDMDENYDDNYDEDDDEDGYDTEKPRAELLTVTADAAISDFFLLELARATGARKRRLERAIDDLRQCFEAVADRILTTPELATRELERQFRPEGAAARVADAYALLYVLPFWLDEPRWHGNDLEDRRLRVHLILPLARFVARLPTFDGSAGGGCVMWDLEYAVRRARGEIRAARQAGTEATVTNG